VAQQSEQTAKEGLRLARTRQEVGVGTQLEVRDAELKLTQAQLNVVGSLVDGREPKRPCAAHRVGKDMTKGRWILGGAVVLLVGFATVQGLRPKAPPPVEVTISVAKKGTVTRVVTAAGHLQARETVKVSSNVTGDLLDLSVKEGDQVKQGQVLGQIDKRLYETQVAQYRGTVASAKASIAQIDVAVGQDKRDLARVQKLVDERLASAADLDKATSQLKMDEGRLASQKELVAQSVGQLETALYNLSRATLTAPIDGTILELSHKVGERIRGSDFSET